MLAEGRHVMGSPAHREHLGHRVRVQLQEPIPKGFQFLLGVLHSRRQPGPEDLPDQLPISRPGDHHAPSLKALQEGPATDPGVSGFRWQFWNPRLTDLRRSSGRLRRSRSVRASGKLLKYFFPFFSFFSFLFLALCWPFVGPLLGFSLALWLYTITPNIIVDTR